jgi:hypothetical protein
MKMKLIAVALLTSSMMTAHACPVPPTDPSPTPVSTR